MKSTYPQSACSVEPFNEYTSLRFLIPAYIYQWQKVVCICLHFSIPVLYSIKCTSMILVIPVIDKMIKAPHLKKHHHELLWISQGGVCIPSGIKLWESETSYRMMSRISFHNNQENLPPRSCQSLTDLACLPAPWVSRKCINGWIADFQPG